MRADRARLLATLTLGFVFAFGTAHAAPPAAGDEGRRFHALLDEEWEWGLRESPIFATAVGDPRYDDKLEDESFAAIERRKAHARELLPRLGRIDRARLSATDQLNYDLFARNARLDVEGQRFPDELLALNQLGGVYSELASLAQQIPRR